VIVITVARKPVAGTVASNVLRHGTGGLNIDGGRVNAPDGVPKFTHREEASINCYGDGKNGSNRTGEMDTQTGRWPANLILDGSEEVLAGFPQTTSPQTYIRHAAGFSTVNSGLKGIGEPAGKDSLNYGDSGSAARFFKQVKE